MNLIIISFGNVKAISPLREHSLLSWLGVANGQPFFDLIWVNFALSEPQKSTKHCVFVTAFFYFDWLQVKTFRLWSIFCSCIIKIPEENPRSSFYEFYKKPKKNTKKLLDILRLSFCILIATYTVFNKLKPEKF